MRGEILSMYLAPLIIYYSVVLILFRRDVVYYNIDK